MTLTEQDLKNLIHILKICKEIVRGMALGGSMSYNRVDMSDLSEVLAIIISNFEKNIK